MITYRQAQTLEDLQEILLLQQKNLPKNLSKDECEREGFVTIEHSLQLLTAMQEAHPHTIAEDDGKLIGYALSMHPTFGHSIPLLKPMFIKIEAQKKHGVHYLVMGQICIAQTHRRKGVFRGLYSAMKTFLTPECSTIITEVDIKNHRSMAAHKAVGFEEFCRYRADGRTWSLIELNKKTTP